MSKEKYQTEKMPDLAPPPADVTPGESVLNDVGTTANGKAEQSTGQ